MPHSLGSKQIRQAYNFLVEAEVEGKVFTAADLRGASGWSLKTTVANITKKLAPLVEKVDGGYRVVGARQLSEESFCRLCSQNSWLAADHQRPLLDPRVEGLVNKAREATLAAVQHYNNPTSVFRSDNYVVLMIIAFTALLHAVFERDGVDYVVYDEKTGVAKTVAGESMLWDVVKSVQQYAEKYGHKYQKNEAVATAENIRFIVPIRHIIEHRYMPQIDVDISGECQALLMNFERILTEEFTSYYSLGGSLSLALQFSTGRSPQTVGALRRFQSAEYEALKKYIVDFRSTLPDDIFGNSAFAFRVYLIPKRANDARRSDLSIEYLDLDHLSQETQDIVDRAIIAVKGVKQEVPGDPTKGKMPPKDVITALTKVLGPTVQFGGIQKKITAQMLRWAVAALGIESPSDMYYHPDARNLSRMYGQPFIERLIEECRNDPDFFYQAKLKATGQL